MFTKKKKTKNIFNYDYFYLMSIHFLINKVTKMHEESLNETITKYFTYPQLHTHLFIK